MSHPLGPCLSAGQILDYLDGRRLARDERAGVDRHLDGCRLCEGAVRGVACLPSRHGFLASIDSLRARLRARTTRAASSARRRPGR